MSFSIGTTLENMVTLDSLGIKNPEDDPRQDNSILLGSRKVKDVGSLTNSWHWGFIHLSQRDILRNYCTGKSAWVYISTYSNEDRLFHTYYCLMLWPEGERQKSGKVIDFTINFMFMQEMVESDYS